MSKFRSDNFIFLLLQDNWSNVKEIYKSFFSITCLVLGNFSIKIDYAVQFSFS